jgi:hypothetical protein
VLLTLPGGGMLLTSMGHWVELAKLEVSEETLLAAARGGGGGEGAAASAYEQLSRVACGAAGGSGAAAAAAEARGPDGECRRRLARRLARWRGGVRARRRRMAAALR